MKIDNTVELVTLSDSLTSPVCKPKSKAIQGTQKVVCLDSDTESDGSQAQTFVKALPWTSNDLTVGASWEKENDSWLGLQICSNARKPSSPILSPSLSCKETLGLRICSNGRKSQSPILSFPLCRENVSDPTTDSEASGQCFKKQKKSPNHEASGTDTNSVARVVKSTKRPSRSAKSIDDSMMALENEIAQLRKRERQVKNKEEREARKQQLKEEKEMLRLQKQEEKKRQQELRKQRTEEERRRKEELKAEAMERRKLEKEKEKWEKGKFALQNITALVDTRILEDGFIGGHLLTRFAEKSFKYNVVKNPIKKTIIWQMKLPSKELMPDAHEDSQSHDTCWELHSSQKSVSQLSLESVTVSYVLVVLEAEEFVELITGGTLDNHIKNLQRQYPGFTLCYLINKLMRCLHKREQQQYKTPGDKWVRPPVEQVLAKLVTSYDGVHSRVCLDEAEVSEHIVGLTRSLAECPFKRKLTPLSLSANGDHVVKNDPNAEVIKKDIWLKALVALPKVSSSCAIAIAKKYPSMSALFEAYLDPHKTVHEKEYLLQDLMKEGLLGGESNRRVGPACSRLVYRILMAQQGSLHTDDVQEGADAFMS